MLTHFGREIVNSAWENIQTKKVHVNSAQKNIQVQKWICKFRPENKYF